MILTLLEVLVKSSMTFLTILEAKEMILMMGMILTLLEVLVKRMMTEKRKQMMTMMMMMMGRRMLTMMKVMRNPQGWTEKMIQTSKTYQVVMRKIKIKLSLMKKDLVVMIMMMMMSWMKKALEAVMMMKMSPLPRNQSKSLPR